MGGPRPLEAKPAGRQAGIRGKGGQADPRCAGRDGASGPRLGWLLRYAPYPPGPQLESQWTRVTHQNENASRFSIKSKSRWDVCDSSVLARQASDLKPVLALGELGDQNSAPTRLIGS